MKTKWKMLLVIMTAGLLVASCAVFERIGISGKRHPDPVFLYQGDHAPYEGWLVEEGLLKDITKEAYR